MHISYPEVKNAASLSNADKLSDRNYRNVECSLFFQNLFQMG